MSEQSEQSKEVEGATSIMLQSMNPGALSEAPQPSASVVASYRSLGGGPNWSINLSFFLILTVDNKLLQDESQILIIVVLFYSLLTVGIISKNCQETTLQDKEAYCGLCQVMSIRTCLLSIPWKAD
ncbi:hypothetical protein HNY73_017702 [Argiope bruennichi]|uniref:Uncharacterized protein n=1 Tax=Argiope bruennichi TaxID=94029 RepID=A0A8T0EEJ3_ARGBR|nr:hypothetical protein HNY73_017702 [Argiope bruennichi]